MNSGGPGSCPGRRRLKRSSFLTSEAQPSADPECRHLSRQRRVFCELTACHCVRNSLRLRRHLDSGSARSFAALVRNPDISASVASSESLKQAFARRKSRPWRGRFLGSCMWNLCQYDRGTEAVGFLVFQNRDPTLAPARGRGGTIHMQEPARFSDPGSPLHCVRVDAGLLVATP